MHGGILTHRKRDRIAWERPCSVTGTLTEVPLTFRWRIEQFKTKRDTSNMGDHLRSYLRDKKESKGWIELLQV